MTEDSFLESVTLLGAVPAREARKRINRGWLARAFQRQYLQSLHDYRFFYDDLAEAGDPEEAEYVFYFVPGLNGVPGQMRFLLPSLVRVFGRRIYLKALYIPEFSAMRPIWEKYRVENIERKLAQLRHDLKELLDRFERVTVLASSNGFYDFAAAAGDFDAATLRDRVHLIWGACAPDRIEPSPWERVFFPLSGFELEGHRWFAYPNHNALQALNPEATTGFAWREAGQHRHFVKMDLESRFRFLGLEWGFVSTTRLNEAVRYVVRQIDGPLELDSEALVAAQDGYWSGKPIRAMAEKIRSYLPNSRLLIKPASHLWVATPTYVTEVMQHVRQRVPPLTERCAASSVAFA